MSIWHPEIAAHAGSKYEAIVAALVRDIQEGRLESGDRLPTHRDLAERLGVTVGTVSRAYKEAKRRGLVSSVVGRGTFVRSPGDEVFSFEPPPESDDEIIELSFNTTDPHVAMSAIRSSCSDFIAGGGITSLLGYQPSAGAARDRRAGAAWLARAGLEVEPDQVIVTSGAQNAMMLALSVLTEPGDLVLTEALTYPGMKTLARFLGLEMHGLAMDSQGLRPDEFAEICRRRNPRALYCTPTIQNPTATVMPENRRREVAEIARAHDVAVVEDDIYAYLLADAPRPISALLPESGYYLASLSKCVAPGLRVGYLRAPRAALPDLAATMMSTSIMATPFTAALASKLVEDGVAEDIVELRRREVERRQALARSLLGEHISADSSRFSTHLWMNLPDPWRAGEFVAQARMRGVAVASPELFAVGRGAAPHAVRLSVCAPADESTLRRGLEVLAELLDSPPGPSLAGM